MNNGKIREFTDLKAWQEGHSLVILIYRVTKTFPQREAYSLTDQMRRAVVSITSNIGEGFGRHSYKEKIQYYYLAQGSLVELKNQILIAKDVGYINEQAYDEMKMQADTAHQLLQGLIKKSKTFLNHES